MAPRLYSQVPIMTVEEVSVGRWVPVSKRTKVYTSVTVCECHNALIALLLSPRPGERKKIPVYVHAMNGKQAWDGNPFFSPARHNRHSGWVYRSALRAAELRASGFDPEDPLLRD